MDMALKIEKKDKSPSILQFEYNVLQMLQDASTKHIAKVHEYVKNPVVGQQNFIVMELLGSNLAKVKRN